MLKKLALAAALAAFAAAPVLAQPTSSQPAATKTAKGKRTCYDLAWDSQAQKDCLAKRTASTSTSSAPKKAMKKSKKTT